MTPRYQARRKSLPEYDKEAALPAQDSRARLFWFIRRILSTAILAALLAVVIQMARQPDGIPPAQPANEAQAGQLLQALQTFAASTYARAIDVTRD